MFIKIRTLASKTLEGKHRNTFLMYDQIYELSYADKAYRIESKEEACALKKNVLSRGDIIVFCNGDPETRNCRDTETWRYNCPFPYNWVSFLNKDGKKIQIYYNTELYICNDKGDTLERIMGY